jgi:hypothetical protein
MPNTSSTPRTSRSHAAHANTAPQLWSRGLDVSRDITGSSILSLRWCFILKKILELSKEFRKTAEKSH